MFVYQEFFLYNTRFYAVLELSIDTLTMPLSQLILKNTHINLHKVDQITSEHISLLTDRPSETVTRGCSAKKIFLRISQNLQENTFVGVYVLIKL